MKNRITEEEFEKYMPQINHIVGAERAAFSGRMYETFGEELQYVRSMASNPATCNRVWTIIDGDDSLIYSAGFHLINRLGYLITEIPFENTELWVELEID